MIPIPRVGVAFDAGEIVEQWLYIARASPSSKPDTILMDEPCSALDPIATGATEELMSFSDPSDARTEDHISGRFG